MKKALLGLLMLALMASAAAATEVTISGELRPVFSYSSVSGSKPWLSFTKSDVTFKADPVDDVVTEFTLRLQSAGTTDFLYKVSTTINDLFMDGLSLKVGKFYLPFTEFKHNLIYCPGIYVPAGVTPGASWFQRNVAATLTYEDPAFAVSGGVYNATVEGAKSAVIKASTAALLEGIYVAAAVKSDANVGERANALSLVGQYKWTDLTLDAEYAMALNGAVKPSVILLGAAYQFMPELLGAIRFESYKEDAIDYIIDGGLAYMLRQGTQAIGEITHVKDKASGDTSMLYTVGLRVCF